MLTFLLVLVLVFIGVDLLVRFVIDPLASSSHKKNKTQNPSHRDLILLSNLQAKQCMTAESRTTKKSQKALTKMRTS